MKAWQKSSQINFQQQVAPTSFLYFSALRSNHVKVNFDTGQQWKQPLCSQKFVYKAAVFNPFKRILNLYLKKDDP